MVFACLAIFWWRAIARLICGHFRKFHIFHHEVHSSDADEYAIITLEDIRNLVSAEALVAVSINMQNDTSYTLVFYCSGSLNRVKMLVIGTSVNVKYAAQCFDFMLKTKLVYSIQTLFECGVNMAIAFFNMRFSSSN